MHLEFRLPAGLLERRRDEIPSAASAYFRQFSHARLSEGLLGRLAANAVSAARDTAAGWREWAYATLFAGSLPQALAGVRAARETLYALGEDGRVRLAQQDQLIERREAVLAGAEAALAAAAGSLLIGRDGRVRATLDAFTKAAQALLDARRQHGLIRGQLAVWGDIDAELEALDRLIDGLSGRLAVIARRLEADTTEEMRRLSAGDAITISLADESYVRTLYRRFCSPDLAFMSLAAFDRPEARVRPVDLAALNTTDLARSLVVAATELFVPVARLTVDEVVNERAAEVGPRARRQQLFDRATPSWNIDRTRLPDGGDGLVRLEILGVPDSRQTSFSEEPMLVSTGDPHRITALVIVAGAPATALQQYDRYQTALARARAVQPIHVLPAFVADANRGRLAFALGVIFGLIENQGSYFYVCPADSVDDRLPLGNGFLNAVAAVAARETLATDLMDRANGRIAQVGIQEAVARLRAYYQTPTNGRTPLDELTRELKRLVRDFADELAQIDSLGGK
jgi:hypothetical protein